MYCVCVSLHRQGAIATEVSRRRFQAGHPTKLHYTWTDTGPINRVFCSTFGLISPGFDPCHSSDVFTCLFQCRFYSGIFHLYDGQHYGGRKPGSTPGNPTTIPRLRMGLKQTCWSKSSEYLNLFSLRYRLHHTLKEISCPLKSDRLTLTLNINSGLIFRDKKLRYTVMCTLLWSYVALVCRNRCGHSCAISISWGQTRWLFVAFPLTTVMQRPTEEPWSDRNVK